MTSNEGAAAKGIAQTLSRGIRVLEVLADRGGGATIPELVSALGLHRSIVYRLLRTLEEHGLVTRDEGGRVRLGLRLAALASRVEHDVQSAALGELRAAAEDLGATCFIGILDRGEVVTLVSVEPSRTRVTVAEHPGTRHPLGIGGPGRAVAAQLPESEWPAATDVEVMAGVLREGFASSRDEVNPGLRAVAVPLAVHRHAPMTVAVVYVSAELTIPEIAARLTTAAERIRAAIESPA
ncbi:MAG TPA: helix-turn-helix domain-containing protein [Microbacteriaceae bacterium]|nr:helix-turn-helix domain-containing protein [Microbacteriaceae bacterium]